MARKRKDVRNPNSRPPGRPRTEVSELAEREGISRQAAWWRLRKSTGRPRGRPRLVKEETIRE